jgi:hypothetical protein
MCTKRLLPTRNITGIAQREFVSKRNERSVTYPNKELVETWKEYTFTKLGCKGREENDIKWRKRYCFKIFIRMYSVLCIVLDPGE